MVLSIKQTLTPHFRHAIALAAASAAAGWLLSGCGARPIAQAESHVQPEIVSRSKAAIPSPVMAVPLPPPPEARDAEVRYSVVVTNQPVREVLMAMARETRVNFDIHPGIEGSVNLNAIDQTLRQILTRMSKQIDMRWESEGETISVMPDTPYLRNYKVDYVNMSRDASGTIGVQNQVVAPPVAGANAGNSAQNSSLLKVDNSARNRFWETLERNLKDMLRETDKLLPEGSSETFVQNRGQSAIATNQARTVQQPRSGRTTTTRSGTTVENPGETATRETADFVEQRLTFREAASVIVNAETGIISVRGTSRQHEKVSEFIQQVMGSARRQVLIEATIVEVRLSDRYQSGVDWASLGLNGLGYTFRQNLLTGELNNPLNPFFSIQYSNPNAAAGGSISSTIKLLDTFGRTRVLSSPRIMAVNNQTAVLKVVDNLVYFTVDVTPATLSSTGSVLSPATVKTTPQLVPVGFIMNVTPQIADNDVIVLNVRPTVTTKVDEVLDPNPELARVNVQNKVPIIRSREFESVLRIPSGSTAILGGLMEDSFSGSRTGLPILSRVPIFGDAVSARDDTATKRELVVFLRPVVIREASIEGDLSAYRRYVPAEDFFRDTHSPLPELERGLSRMEQGKAPVMEAVPVVPAPPNPRP